jgi:hypothetical protein
VGNKEKKMAFDPKRHTIKVQGGREYLPVSARLVWFRNDHPDWGIVTTPVEINLEKQYAIFSCSIFNAEGKVMATATKMENVRGFGDYLEKAETGSVGRALAYCGYGTQFAPELEEGGRLADAPYPMGGNRFANSGGSRPPMGMGNGNGGNGNGNGGGMNRMPPPPAQRPAPAPVPPPLDEDDVFADAPEPPRAAAPPARPAPAPARPAPANGGGITRVPEPERDYGDPAGDGEDEEDPFADDGAATPPAPRAAAGRPAPTANRVAEDSGQDPAPAPKPNPLAGNRCSVDGCSNVLTASQMTMSTNKFGRPLCLLHQREAQPVGAAAGGGARRPAKAEPADTLL